MLRCRTVLTSACLCCWLVTYNPNIHGQLPDTVDLGQQVELLKQIRDALNSRELSDEGSENHNALNLDAEQIRRLVELAGELDLSDRNRASELMQKLPPELLRELATSPDLQQMIRTILQSSRDSRPPTSIPPEPSPNTRGLDTPVPQERRSQATLPSNAWDTFRKLNFSPPPNASAEADPVSRLAKQLRGSNFWDTVRKAVEKQRTELRQKEIANDPSVGGRSGANRLPGTSSGALRNTDLSAISESLGKSLKDLGNGIGKKVKEVASHPRFRPPERPKKTVSAFNSGSPETPSPAKKKASDAAGGPERLNQPSANQDETASSSIASNSAPIEAPEKPMPHEVASGGVYALVVLAAVCIVVAIIASLYRYFMFNAWSHSTADGTKRIVPREVRTREHLITAYHHLASTGPSPAQTWWTHRRAALHLSEQTPVVRQPVNYLVELYEKARYYPEQIELTAAELESARHALERCQAR